MAIMQPLFQRIQTGTFSAGDGLEAGEYIVVSTGSRAFRAFSEQANYVTILIPQYGGKSQIQLFDDFKKTYGPKVVQGVLRAHAMSPPFVFYCNKD